MKFPSIIAADNFIWCLVSVQIVDIFYPIMSFQIVLREAVQVGYMVICNQTTGTQSLLHSARHFPLLLAALLVALSFIKNILFLPDLCKEVYDTCPQHIGFLSGFAVSLEFDEIHVNALAPACTLSIDTARTGSRPGPLGSQNDM